MTSEMSFKAYFMKAVEHGYRTALVTGSGFPDCLLIHGDRHSFVELKLLKVGPSRDKKLKGLFKKTQPPWYMNYLSKGGKRLFVLFKLNKGYGLLHVNMGFVRDIDTLKYSDLLRYPYPYIYAEYPSLKKLIGKYLA